MFKQIKILLACFLLAGCSTNPATGRPSFTGFMPASQEAAIGAQEHDKIIAQFNGKYDNAKLNQFVQEIGKRLVEHSERQDVQYTFTLLNDDMVNAFAVPGGYIYVTRGLLSIAEDEAEIAAVMAHEMGHITARHSAQQMSQSALLGIGTQIVGIATGNQTITQVAGLSSQLYLKGYSRSHEFEADTLGIRYTAQEGYDPTAMARFLEKLERNTRFEAEMAGNPALANQFSYFQTHPPTGDRIDRAFNLAAQKPRTGNEIGRTRYLNAIDGTVYGEAPEQGYIRGKDFIHVPLGFRFSVPDGFQLINTPKVVVAKHKNGSQIIFDMGKTDLPLQNYLVNVWAKGAPMASPPENITINGLKGVTAATRLQNGHDARLVVVQAGGGEVYRMVFSTPQRLTTSMSEDMRKSSYSLRKLTAQEKASIKPHRIRVITVQAGDTVQSLANNIPTLDYKVERFSVLNGIDPNTPLKAGQKLKTIVGG